MQICKILIFLENISCCCFYRVQKQQQQQQQQQPWVSRSSLQRFDDKL